jgi:drug/metabolite transporter (DMT)-like permease
MKKKGGVANNARITSDDYLNYNDNNLDSNLIIGSLYGISHMIIVSLNVISNKVMIKDAIPFNVLSLWTGITNVICSSLFSLFFIEISINSKLIFYSFINSLIMYVGFLYNNKGMTLIDVSKAVPFGYMSIITVFVMGGLFLSEPIYVSDVIGSMLIMGFNIFNSMKPIK